MSIVGLFTEARPEIQVDGESIFFDATLEESTELVTEITNFPIEDGSEGNDHAVQRPLVLTMRVGVSDNFFREQRAAASDLASAQGGVIGAAIGLAISQLPSALASLVGIGSSTAGALSGSSRTRSGTALEQIRDIQRRKKLITVVGSKREYENMIIASTRQETNKENEQALELVVEFRQLIVIGQGDETANVPAPGDVAATLAQPLVDLGRIDPR